jgi:uncharacterized protein YejL (UPF0352 family)
MADSSSHNITEHHYLTTDLNLINMKRVILPLISFLLISGVASAQTLKTKKKQRKALVNKVKKDKPATSTSGIAVPVDSKIYLYADRQKTITIA